MKLKKLTQSCIFTVCEVYTNVTDQILIKSLCMSKPGILFLKHNISNSNIYVFINLIHFKGVYGRFLLLFFFVFFLYFFLIFLVFFHPDGSFIWMSRRRSVFIYRGSCVLSSAKYGTLNSGGFRAPPPKIRKAYVIQR